MEVRTGAPSSTLASLHEVLLPEVVRWLPLPLDVARLDCTSRLFHIGAPRSAVEEGLRLRAEAAGWAVEAALPAKRRRGRSGCCGRSVSCWHVHRPWRAAANTIAASWT